MDVDTFSKHTYHPGHTGPLSFSKEEALNIFNEIYNLLIENNDIIAVRAALAAYYILEPVGPNKLQYYDKLLGKIKNLYNIITNSPEQSEDIYEKFTAMSNILSKKSKETTSPEQYDLEEIFKLIRKANKLAAPGQRMIKEAEEAAPGQRMIKKAEEAARIAEEETRIKEEKRIAKEEEEEEKRIAQAAKEEEEKRIAQAAKEEEEKRIAQADEIQQIIDNAKKDVDKAEEAEEAAAKTTFKDAITKLIESAKVLIPTKKKGWQKATSAKNMLERLKNMAESNEEKTKLYDTLFKHFTPTNNSLEKHFGNRDKENNYVFKEKYELIENEDEFYKSKYLKYKNKYLELKKKLNK